MNGPSQHGKAPSEAFGAEEEIRHVMASENVKTFTDEDFETVVLKSSEPVLVDFWAAWCGPCRRLSPTVEEVAGDLKGRLTVGKMNVDENPNTAFKYSIRGIPTLLLFKDGQIVE